MLDRVKKMIAIEIAREVAAALHRDEDESGTERLALAMAQFKSGVETAQIDHFERRIKQERSDAYAKGYESAKLFLTNECEGTKKDIHKLLDIYAHVDLGVYYSTSEIVGFALQDLFIRYSKESK